MTNFTFAGEKRSTKSLPHQYVHAEQTSAYPSCQEESRAVGSSVVGETGLDSIARQLVGVGSTQDLVTLDLSVDDLHAETMMIIISLA